MVDPGVLVAPGTRLGLLAPNTSPGLGTYLLNGVIYSSVVGVVVKSDDGSVLVKSTIAKKAIVPKVGDLVIVVVAEVSITYITVSIICVGSNVLAEPFEGRIRVEDIRTFDKEEFKVYDCFRLGDVVRGRILSLGTGRSFYVSAAENILGVILARSESGASMTPISWTTMQCPTTKTIEKRKVAHPHQ